MSLKDLTSAGAVLKAIAEFKRVGQTEFLRKHGFGPARRYFLEHEGSLYDSKAVVGVAHGYQFPEQGALGSHDFSGGEATVRRKLEDLDFKVHVVPVVKRR
jgi:hypothetical protein